MPTIDPPPGHANRRITRLKDPAKPRAKGSRGRKDFGRDEPKLPPRTIALRAVGAFLRSAREALGMTQDEVALKTNRLPWPVSRATIGAIEQGKQVPNAMCLIGLAQVLRVDPMEVFDRFKFAARPPRSTRGVDYDGLLRMYGVAFAAGDFRGGLALLDATMARVLEGSTEPDNETIRRQVTLETYRAVVLRRLGALTAAKGAAERAINLAPKEPDLLADAYTMLAAIQMRLGNRASAIDAIDRAVMVATSCGPASSGRAWLEKGHVLLSSGQHEMAIEALRRARALSEQAGDLVNVIHAAGNLGLCFHLKGQHREARARVNEGVELARKRFYPAHEASWLVYRGVVEQAAGRTDDAWESAAQAIEIAGGIEDWLTVFRGVALQHRIARLRNPLDPDRHRVAYMKRILGWIDENVDEPDVVEFLVELRKGSVGEKGRSS